MPKKNWTDDELIRIVWDWRLANGACSIDDIRKSTGMSKSGVHKRITNLVAEGRLLQSESYSSLRGADERLMRELPNGRLVEVTKFRKSVVGRR